MTSAGPSAAVTRIVHRYGAVVVLDEVSFELRSGVTALVGANGAGKSTLLSILSGSQRPTRGRAVVAGRDVNRRGERREALRHVAFVPQLPAFPPNLTALELVAYAAWMRGMRASRTGPASRAALANVGLEARAGVKLGRLSGGMLRRVALAQAIVGGPQVLLLDEPSTGLDPQQRRTMVDLVKTLDGTVLVSSHVMEDVEEVADRILVLDGGRLMFDGAPASLAGRAREGTPPHRRLEAAFLEICRGGGPS